MAIKLNNIVMMVIYYVVGDSKRKKREIFNLINREKNIQLRKKINLSLLNFIFKK